MALRNILQDGDETLNKVSRKVVNFDSRLYQLLDDMADTLHFVSGVGLAAPQVGVLRRVCIVEVDENDLLELINPEIISTEGEQEGPEACLSVPEMTGIVKRPMNVTVRAQNRDGEWFEVTGEELKARALCHEIDHLDGILYTSLASELFTKNEDEAEE